MTMYDDYGSTPYKCTQAGCCRTCCYWGENPELISVEGEHLVVARCSNAEAYTWQIVTCDNWRPRSGQPLGTGVLPAWFQSPENDWKAPASILHDLRYDVLKPGESTAAIDREWWDNCYRIAGEDWSKRRIADVGYLIIRVFGILKQGL